MARINARRRRRERTMLVEEKKKDIQVEDVVMIQ